MGPRFWTAVWRLAACVLPAQACWAQLVPDRTYYGKDRPIPMTVTVPEGMEGEPEVLLLAPVTAEVVGRAPVAAGPVNLATLLPQVWRRPGATGIGPSPMGRAPGQPTPDRSGEEAGDREIPPLVYAQLAVGGTKVGPAVVMQPMVTPVTPVVDAAGVPRFPPEATRTRTFSGYRAYTDRLVVLETDRGTIELALRPDAAPNTVWTFIGLVEGGFYTDVEFHRVVPANRRGEAFVIQTGDPTGTGRGGPGFFIDLENSPLPHGFGVASMARTRDPNANGSQFFICLSRAATAGLDGQYTTFAQTVGGEETIAAIAAVPIGRDDRPLDPAPRIVSARTAPAPPYGEGKAPVKEPGERPVDR